MPSIFQAHVSLDQETWLWHRRNPGQLSRLAKEAIRKELAAEDGCRVAAQAFRSIAESIKPGAHAPATPRPRG